MKRIDRQERERPLNGGHIVAQVSRPRLANGSNVFYALTTDGHDKLEPLVSSGGRMPGGRMLEDKFRQRPPMPAAVEKPNKTGQAIVVTVTSDLNKNGFFAELTTSSNSGARYNVGVVALSKNGFAVSETEFSPVGKPWGPTREQFAEAVRSAQDQLEPLRGH